MLESNFLKTLKDRQYLYQCTDLDSLDALLVKQKISIYVGFDCTASHLHVGHLLPLMMMRIAQRLGYRPIILLGGATTKIGDPSGKDKTRSILSEADIANNITTIKEDIAKFIQFEGTENNALLLNNDDWFQGVKYIDFLRDIGSLFSINQMLQYDSVKLRLEREQSLTFLEFNYMILQAFDFVHLSQNHQCYLQMSGSDQWGNMINGIELNRKLHHKSPDFQEIFGLTSELLTTSNGKKMGKTETGAIWLNSKQCSSFDYFQFWRNVTDQDCIKFLKLFTELPLEKIQELEKLEGKEINEAKKILAFEATKICHGEQEALLAAKATQETYEQGIVSQSLPTKSLSQDLNIAIDEKINITTLLSKLNMTKSNSEAKTFIKSGAVKINDNKVNDLSLTIQLEDGDKMKISVGKKNHIIITK